MHNMPSGTYQRRRSVIAAAVLGVLCARPFAQPHGLNRSDYPWRALAVPLEST